MGGGVKYKEDVNVEEEEEEEEGCLGEERRQSVWGEGGRSTSPEINLQLDFLVNFGQAPKRMN